MRYLSVCSGIESATVAWHPLAWKAAAFSEIGEFPRAVLSHHYPEVPLFGDFTEIQANDVGPIDVLVGGTPCQSFSIAGLRGGMDDDRGNLALEFCRLADRTRPRWICWENVPGLLSSNSGRDFGTFLGALAERGYGFAYRILDAQFTRTQSHPFAVPQRRRRVFLVGYLGDWRPAAAVILERESLQRNHPPCRKTRKETTQVVNGGTGTRVRREFDLIDGVQSVASALDTSPYADHESKESRLVAYQCHGTNVGPMGTIMSGNGNVTGGVPFVSRTLPSTCGGVSGGSHPVIVCKSRSSFVRRLSPMECERLMGFPDCYTLVSYRGKPASDSPRYKALGNSMAVNCMSFIGQRIDLVEKILARVADLK